MSEESKIKIMTPKEAKEKGYEVKGMLAFEKKKTDREIVEYLDESVCFVTNHIKENPYPADGDPLWVCNGCGKHRHENPTPTLEWMLGKVKEKEGVDSVYFNLDSGEKPDEFWCEIEGYIEAKNLVWAEGSHGTTPTLALRGAVVKLMESEETK